MKGVCVHGSPQSRLIDVDLRIYEGERIALLGKSGAGKSTLLAVANGSLSPDQGLVCWRGIPLEQRSDRQRQAIATLWQDLRLVEELSVGQNINAGALSQKSLVWAIVNLLGVIDADVCRRCLQAAGLSIDLLNRSVSQLSGGQRQRVAIARLLRQKAELILADEPLSSLDPVLVKDVLDLILRENQSSDLDIGSTVIVSLHRPELIDHFDRVIGVQRGKVVVDLPTENLDSDALDWLYHC